MATLELEGKSFPIDDGDPIKEVCRGAGIPFGCEDGMCGTCIVEVVDGMENLSDFGDEEIDFFGDDGGEMRLACQCRILKGKATLRGA